MRRFRGRFCARAGASALRFTAPARLRAPIDGGLATARHGRRARAASHRETRQIMAT